MVASSVPKASGKLNSIAIQIEVGQRLAVGDHRRNARNGRQEASQWTIDAEQHFGAERGDHGRVARELDGIAHALLGTEKNRLARDRGFAAPDRPRETHPPGCEFRVPPTLFILGPAGAEIADAEPRQRLVELRIRMLRVARQRGLVIRQRLGHAVERARRYCLA